MNAAVAAAAAAAAVGVQHNTPIQLCNLRVHHGARVYILYNTDGQIYYNIKAYFKYLFLHVANYLKHIGTKKRMLYSTGILCLHIGAGWSYKF